MNKLRWMIAAGSVLLGAAWMLDAAKVEKDVISGSAAFVSAKDLKPGSFRKITSSDLPNPTKGTPNFGRLATRPEGMMPQAPAGFKVELYASNLKEPRQIRTAPNGDMFFAESNAGEIKVIHDNNGKPEISVFTTGQTRTFGINFYPPGPNPQWVYIGNTGSVVRFPYKNGDRKASGPAETLISDLAPNGNHWTRDVVFSKDGRRMFVAVGSADNVSDAQPVQERRANILEYTP